MAIAQRIAIKMLSLGTNEGDAVVGVIISSARWNIAGVHLIINVFAVHFAVH